MLSACFHHEQQLQDSVLLLQSQLQLLHSHTAQLQQLADKAVATAVRGTAGLKDDPTKNQQQQQPNVSPSLRAATSTRAALNAFQGLGPVPILAAGSQVSPAKGPGVPGSGNSGIPVQRTGSGGSNRAAGGAAAGGGRAHLARQQQDEQALRQMWSEQQSLRQEWHSRLQQLVSFEGELDAFKQVAAEAGLVDVVAAGRHAVALPWHLGQQEDEQQQQEQEGQGHEQQPQPQQGPHRALVLPAAADDVSVAMHAQPIRVDSNALSTAPPPGSALNAAATENTTIFGAAAGSAAPGLVAVVAPARQKQAAAQKRKAADVQSLLKRRRR
jgi:hypothetical protein